MTVISFPLKDGRGGRASVGWLCLSNAASVKLGWDVICTGAYEGSKVTVIATPTRPVVIGGVVKSHMMIVGSHEPTILGCGQRSHDSIGMSLPGGRWTALIETIFVAMAVSLSRPEK